MSILRGALMILQWLPYLNIFKCISKISRNYPLMDKMSQFLADDCSSTWAWFDRLSECHLTVTLGWVGRLYAGKYLMGVKVFKVLHSIYGVLHSILWGSRFFELGGIFTNNSLFVFYKVDSLNRFTNSLNTWLF